MALKIDLGGIEVDVVRKDIKNLHLSVYPPAGAVRIAAPSRMDLGTVRVFAISKLGWIKNQQRTRPRANLWNAKVTSCGESVTCFDWSRRMPRREWS